MSCSRPPIARWRRVAWPAGAAPRRRRRPASPRGGCAPRSERSLAARSTISERTRGPRKASSAPDELGRREVADERARGPALAQVEHGGDGDQHDAQQLHGVAEVEGPGAVAEQQLRHERPAEPDAADADQQVGRAARQRVGPRGAQGEQREARGAEDEQCDRRARCRPGARRSGRRRGRAGRSCPRPTIATARPAWSASTGRRLTGRRIAGSALRARTVAPAGSDAAAREGDDAVRPDEDPGRGEARGSRAARSWWRRRRRAGRCGCHAPAPRRWSARSRRRRRRVAPEATSQKWTSAPTRASRPPT